MAKLTIADALKALQEHGLDVEVKGVKEVPKKSKRKFTQTPHYTQRKTQAKRGVARADTENSQVKLKLHAKHSIASGGHLVKDSAGAHVDESAVISYGPGIVMVPKHLAAQLSYQDTLARKADARFLDKTPKEYLVVQVRGANGQRVHVGKRLPEGSLSDLASLPLSNKSIIL